MAKHAGTRTLGIVELEIFQHLDSQYEGSISFLHNPQSHPDYGEGGDASDGGMHGEGEESPSHTGIFSGAQLPGTPLCRVPPTSPSSDDDIDADSGDEEAHYPAHHPDPSDSFPPHNGEQFMLFFGLFVDGVQLHQHGRHTTTVIALKLLDLPGFLSHKDCAAYPIGYISGPKEPTTMTTIIELIMQQFKQYEPKGVRVENGRVFVEGDAIEFFDIHRQKTRKVFPIFVFAFADTPARRGWLLTTGHNSKSGCDKCGLRSTKTLPNGAPIGFPGFTAYTAPAEAQYFDEHLQVLYSNYPRIHCLQPHYSM